MESWDPVNELSQFLMKVERKVADALFW